jgi:hypothetical protein
MAEVTVMASVRMEALVGPETVSPIALKKYLDVNDISGPQGKLSVTANGGPIPEGSGPSDAAASLMNAINAIPPEQTIRTTISMTISYTPPSSSDEFFGGDTSGMVNEGMYGGKFFIIIDWTELERKWIEGGTVTWNGNQRVEQGRYNGSAEVPGDQLIERFSFTKADPGTFGHPISLMLKTTSERKISGLPIPGIGRRLNEAVFQKVTSLWDGFVDVDYVITTDTGTTVIVAPTPPPPVVSVKISELPEAPSLQDDDLFVLSQDKPDDGIYNISHRVTLANLKASIAGLFAPAITDSDVMSVLAQRDAAFSGTVSLTPTTGKKFAILSCQLDCDAVADAGGNWFLVIGKNLDTDLPTATYPAGSALPVAAQLAEIYKYSVAETSTVPGTDPNATDTNLRYVYVGDGGTVSIPWRVLIMVGPSGAVAVTITVVGWV